MSRNQVSRTARIIGLMLVISALVAPAAQAMPTRGEIAKVKGGLTGSSPQVIHGTVARPLPNPALKGQGVQRPGRDISSEIAAGGAVVTPGGTRQADVKVASSSSGSDFDWGTAGIVAASTAAGMALIGAGMLMSRRNRLSYR
jgi:hypothetical protein